MKRAFYLFLVLLNTSVFSQWKARGDFNNNVMTITSDTGGVIVGGYFTQINQDARNLVVKGKSTSFDPDEIYWSDEISQLGLTTNPFGGPYPGQYVCAVAPFSNGIYIGGSFTQQRYTQEVNIAILTWDGFRENHTFSPLYTTPYAPINALKNHDGKIFIGGDFKDFAGTDFIAYLEDGDDFPQEVGKGLNGSVECFAVYKGELYAGGSFTLSDTTKVAGIARWDGTDWKPVGAGFNGAVYALTVHNDELIAGGFFTASATTPVTNVARWNGTQWSRLGDGLSSGGIRALESYNGSLYAGGSFTKSGTSTVNYLAEWNGTVWKSVTPGPDDFVYALHANKNKLWVGGKFKSVGTQSVKHLATLETIPTGIAEAKNTENAIVFNNPATGNDLTIFNSNFVNREVTIRCVSGSEEYNVILSADNNLDITSLKNGTYLVQFTSGNNIITKKLIVIR